MPAVGRRRNVGGRHQGREAEEAADEGEVLRAGEAAAVVEAMRRRPTGGLSCSHRTRREHSSSAAVADSSHCRGLDGSCGRSRALARRRGEREPPLHRPVLRGEVEEAQEADVAFSAAAAQRPSRMPHSSRTRASVEMGCAILEEGSWECSLEDDPSLGGSRLDQHHQTPACMTSAASR